MDDLTKSERSVIRGRTGFPAKGFVTLIHTSNVDDNDGLIKQNGFFVSEDDLGDFGDIFIVNYKRIRDEVDFAIR